MMGNLPNGAVRGLRPCCICDSMGRFNIKPCEPSGAYSDSRSRLDCCELPSVSRGQATLDDSRNRRRE